MRLMYKVKFSKAFFRELPQNLLGLLLIYTTKAWYSVAWDDCYFTSRIKGLYSLGNFIILSDEYYNCVCPVKKAREFQKLSRKYGWLYLFVLFIKKMGVDNA